MVEQRLQLKEKLCDQLHEGLCLVLTALKYAATELKKHTFRLAVP
jgi:hypothetical protein